MKIEVSLGEVIDKFTILEIKKEKGLEVDEELKHYDPKLKEGIEEEFNLLKIINEEIWIATDAFWNYHLEVSHIGNEAARNAFYLNEARFRIKNRINIKSELKEKKNYKKKILKVKYNPEENFQELNLKILNLFYDEVVVSNEGDRDIDLSLTGVVGHFEKLRKHFTPPIRYLASGLIGDFINQLSVVNEKYLQTGRKGIVMMTERDEFFRRGLETAFKDIVEVFGKEEYIEAFELHQGESYDINLSEWRIKYAKATFTTSWKWIYQRTYEVPWGKHNWLTVEKDEKYKDKIVVFISPARFPNGEEIDLKQVVSNNKEKREAIFFASNDKEYEVLKSKGIEKIERAESLLEMALIIGSAHTVITCISAQLTLAQAMKANTIVLASSDVMVYRNMDDIWPECKWYFNREQHTIDIKNEW